eukprot:357293-Chlamydomonas_euryale.AAC.2
MALTGAPWRTDVRRRKALVSTGRSCPPLLGSVRTLSRLDNASEDDKQDKDLRPSKAARLSASGGSGASPNCRWYVPSMCALQNALAAEDELGGERGRAHSRDTLRSRAVRDTPPRSPQRLQTGTRHALAEVCAICRDFGSSHAGAVAAGFRGLVAAWPGCNRVVCSDTQRACGDT